MAATGVGLFVRLRTTCCIDGLLTLRGVQSQTADCVAGKGANHHQSEK